MSKAEKKSKMQELLKSGKTKLLENRQMKPKQEKTGQEKTGQEKESQKNSVLEKLKKAKPVQTKSAEPKKTGEKGKAPVAKKWHLFSIRNKIFVCFLVPILFMIVVGFAAYKEAADGMNEKYRDSTLQTIKMATEYIDMSDTFIEAEAMKYAFDSDLGKYFLGLYESEPIQKMEIMDSVKSRLLSSQTSNSFISNIHIITKEGINMFSTRNSTGSKGFFKEYREVMSENGKTLQKWVDGHDLLDENLKLTKEDYITSLQIMSQSNNAVVVIDIKASAIEEFLTGLKLGEGSIVGLVTENGRELICENLAEGEESVLTEGEQVFFGQEFFAPINEEDNTSGVEQVKFKGENYLFFYSRSTKDHTTVCALVPLKVVTGQAEAIKVLTIGLVVLASVIAAGIGVWISMGIQNNMRKISRKLGEVAKGDLTVQVKVNGRDEFRDLAASATNMIQNNKKLVAKVGNATGELELSAKEVKEASGVINEYSTDITQAIDEINEGMTKQSEHAQDCVERTDSLSAEMQEVSRVVERVEKLVRETEEMIGRGMGIVQDLGAKAQETTSMTMKVGESIEALRKESEIINNFVGTITDISEQTNLLSLNASIEAARAGEAGRGFAVVAEEIRKLADDSAKAAGEISNNVAHISAQTVNSVESARQAEAMVELQTKAVEEVIGVFQDMNSRMTELVSGLNDIVNSTERADKERSDTLEAVKNISEIIEETANSAEVVRDIALKLLQNVENMNRTADALGENMQELKTEISVFKTE